MQTTRTGKIARIPLAIREQLNNRLLDGDQGRKLVTWLNSLPEVREVLDREFAGKPVRPQNLSEWRKGGYRDWLHLREARHAATQMREEAAIQSSNGETLTETLAHWLAVRYMLASRTLSESSGPQQWKMLRELCGDIVELRRGDHSMRRIELERQRVAAAERDADLKWKRRVIIGLETLAKEIGENPEAKAAFDQLTKVLRHPFDPTESD